MTQRAVASISIEFDAPVDVHRMRNLGEDLWKGLRTDRRAEMSIDEVDAAVDRLVIHIPDPSKARLKWVQDYIAGHLKRHRYDSGCRIVPGGLPDET